MKPVLVLVDLQQDFLAQPGLEPHRERIVDAAGQLLRAARSSGIPVIHIQTTVRREPDERMRHWKIDGRWICVEGTAGHAAPEAVRPVPAEIVLSKTGFSAGRERLSAALSECGGKLAVIAGIHTHACVRQAVLDLYETGMTVWVARDAVGSHEPAHGAQTELYLRQRMISFVPNTTILRQFETIDETAATDAVALSPGDAIARPARLARAASVPLQARLTALRKAADLVDANAERLADEIVGEVGKPVRYARAETRRTAALFRAVVSRAEMDVLDHREPEAVIRRRPLGTIAVISPWNNPLAIPAGQLAPALAFGNAVLWKPAPAVSTVAQSLHRLLLEAGIGPDLLHLIPGGSDAGLALVGHEGIDAVCFTGSTTTGRLVAAACAERHLPLQAELGGNNGAIVTADADLENAARLIAEAAFGCAGQRCTATRRVIVVTDVYKRFVDLLTTETAALGWGDPRLETTQVGPLRTKHLAAGVSSIVERARSRGHLVLQPHLGHGNAASLGDAFYVPTLVLCDDPSAEIVVEETFGPVLVVQRASGWHEALALLNAVDHGLAAALFSARREHQQSFLAEARAGILKINLATVEAGVDVPFGGWKASGIGPPQHGESNRAFFTRPQTVYGAPKQASSGVTEDSPHSSRDRLAMPSDA